jgi:tetratricopeptide (TPR) repeat protein
MNLFSDTLKEVTRSLAQDRERAWRASLEFHNLFKKDLPFTLLVLLTVLRTAGYLVVVSILVVASSLSWFAQRFALYATWWWRKLRHEPIEALIFFLAVLTLVAALAAEFQRIVKPTTTVVVAPFEMTERPPKAFPLTGKTVANLLKDEIGEMVSERAAAATYLAVSEAYEPNSRKEERGQEQVRSVALGEGAEVSSVAIEVEGLSLEKIVALYNQISQTQKRIQGDVVFQFEQGVSSPVPAASNIQANDKNCQFVLRARIFELGNWQTGPYACAEAQLKKGVHELAEAILKSLSPNAYALYLDRTERNGEAIAILRQLVAKQPGDVVSILDLSQALYSGKHYEEAKEQLREALRLQPKYPEQVHNNLGLALYDSDKFQDVDGAEAEYREAIRINGHWSKPHNNLSRLLSNRGEFEAALRECLEALEIDKNDADAHDIYGTLLDVSGKIRQATGEFREAVRLQPRSVPFHIDLGAELEKTGNYDAAVTEYQECIRLRPHDKWGHTNLGNALTELAKFDEAIQEHRKALELEPDAAEVFVNLGYTYEAMGDFKNALEQYSAALRINPDSIMPRCNLAYILDLLGEYDAAVINYEYAVARTEPERDTALAENRYGDFLRNDRKFDEALAHYHKALESGATTIYSKNGSDFDARDGMGRIYEEQRKAREAQREFGKAIALRDPADVAAASSHAELGQILEGIGRRREAIDEYKTALKADLENTAAWPYLANALESEGEYAEAQKARDKAIIANQIALARKPKDWSIQLNLADVYAQKHDYETAKRLLDAAWEIRPNEVQLQNEYGVAEELQGNQDTAIQYYQLAIKTNGNFWLGYQNLGYALDLKGQHKDAIGVYRKALEGVPDDPTTHTLLGVAYENAGMLNESISEHRLSIRLCEDFPLLHLGEPCAPDARTNLCKALVSAREYDDAISECAKAISATPRFAEAHLRLGQALIEKSKSCTFCWSNHVRKRALEEFKTAAAECRSALVYRDMAETRYILASAYEGMGQHYKALQQFDMAVQWKPSYPRALFDWGLVLKALGRHYDANGKFAEAAALDSSLIPPAN